MSDDKKLPRISSSWVLHAGVVDEVTWTSEDDVIRKLGYSQYDYVKRGQLRTMGAGGVIVCRLHPEHHFYEYGPQWRNKDFKLMLDAAEAANRLGRPDE